MKGSMLAIFSLTILLTGCGPSTKIEKSWADPSLASGPKPFKKVLVIGLLKDESTRRIAEDKMVSAIKASAAVQSYRYVLPTDTKDNTAELGERMKKDGFDGIVIMRLADMEKSMNYVPGTTYGGWGGYYGYAGGFYGSPGYYTEDKTYFVETNVYSLGDDKLMWSGMTSTINPSKTPQMIDEIISTIKGQMQKEGLIAK